MFEAMDSKLKSLLDRQIAKMLYRGFRLVAALRIAYQLLFLCR